MTIQFYQKVMLPKSADRMANSLDTDQAASLSLLFAQNSLSVQKTSLGPPLQYLNTAARKTNHLLAVD